jgi:hypothetical protein
MIDAGIGEAGGLLDHEVIVKHLSQSFVVIAADGERHKTLAKLSVAQGCLAIIDWTNTVLRGINPTVG